MNEKMSNVLYQCEVYFRPFLSIQGGLRLHMKSSEVSLVIMKEMRGKFVTGVKNR